MKAKHFLNGLKPAHITHLAPLDIQTYAEMVKKAQLLEDVTDLIDHIKGRIVKKEQTLGSSSKPTNGKKRPFSITDGPSQEHKPKVFTPSAPNKPRCKHCDKLGHTADECWRKGTSVDTTCASVNTLSQNSPEGVLGRPLVSTLLELVSTHCPRLARSIVSKPGTSVDTTCASVDTLSQNSPEGVLGRPLVSTLLELVSTHCPRLARRCSGSCL
ncbi:hypothetical protein Taro_029466 [Colocasia esculenta]|uniref:CCHC-type domain-containing protein n=1 Tax=Colocasia esculenta TaxID=4460 RepID=A0A843VJ05_COLES|nr:hypothetical protein [Colocasia esculenta]